MTNLRIGLVAANRGFFSNELASRMRGETIRAMEKAGMEVVVPDQNLTAFGTVADYEEAIKCARLFREADVKGIIVAAVNFGDEQSVAVAIKESGLDVPVLIFGCQEEEVLTMQTPRRDSFCGLLSIGDALRQVSVKYTVARIPICFPGDVSFAEELERFAAVCRVVTGLRGARYGQIGARPNDFWTCRFSEMALQSALNITTVTVDLSEILARINQLDPDSDEVKEAAAAIGGYTDISRAPDETLSRQARFDVALREMAERFSLDAMAVQCWSSLQENLGMCSCTVMGRLGEVGIPCACEADILGAMSMHALKLASDSPAALADWNNIHNDDPDLVNIWHCGVFPSSFARTAPKMGTNDILGGAFGHDNAWGVTEFIVKDGPITVSRIAQDNDGSFKGLVVPAAFEPNRAETFGAYGWARIDNLTSLYRDVLCRHFPHHTAFCYGSVSDALWEAFGNYLGFEVYSSGQAAPGVWTPLPPFAARSEMSPGRVQAL